MNQSPHSDAGNQPFQTFQELLQQLATFGCRYRIGPGEPLEAYIGKQTKQQASLPEGNKGGRVFPSELLARLQKEQDPLLRGECAIFDGPADGWDLCFVYAVVNGVSCASTPCQIEDLLNLARVQMWLEQRPSHEIVAVLQPEAQISTFLTTYYQDQIGGIPEDLDKVSFPVWCDYLERFVYSLDLDERRERPTSVNAATLACWMELIRSIFNTGRHDNIDLDDEASE